MFSRIEDSHRSNCGHPKWLWYAMISIKIKKNRKLRSSLTAVLCRGCQVFQRWVVTGHGWGVSDGFLGILPKKSVKVQLFPHTPSYIPHDSTCTWISTNIYSIYIYYNIYIIYIHIIYIYVCVFHLLSNLATRIEDNVSVWLCNFCIVHHLQPFASEQWIRET